MSVLLYKGAKYRTLAGKKIFRNGKWIALPASAKMYLNGQWYPLGRTVPGSSVPDIPDMPEAPEITHINGEEPSGKKWYISPAGSGAQDGTSWADSAPQSMIHVIMLQCTSGDSVCFTEGNYTTDRVIVLPAGVSFYGGFAEDNPAWDTRDGFKHPTLFTGDGSFDFMEGGNAVDGQTLDGISVKGYANAVSNGEMIALRNGTFEDAPVTCAKAEYCVFNRTSVTCSGDLLNCNIFYAEKVTASGNAARLYVCGSENVKTTLQAKTLTDCSLNYADCNAGNMADVFCYHGGVFQFGGTAERVAVHGGDVEYPEVLLFNASDCTVIHCQPRTYTIFDSTSSNMFAGENAVNCTVKDCSVQKSCSIFDTPATNCRVVDCRIKIAGTAGMVLFGESATNCIVENFYTDLIKIASGDWGAWASICKVFSKDSHGCIAININGSSAVANFPQGMAYGYVFLGEADGCILINSSVGCGFDNTSSFSVALNCTGEQFFTQSATNCIILNCNAVNCFFDDDARNCNAVSCSAPVVFDANAKNCVSWNNECVKEYSGSTACAGSVYTDDLALTLGYDNTIARFTNTGYYPAQGVQDVGDCPSPVDDPDGFKAYVAAFGDWHPLSNSFLIGKGTALEDVTTDLDGVTRPAPPTIGTYEPRPE